MMNVHALHSLLEIITLIGLGFYCKSARVFGRIQFKGIEHLLIKIALPCSLFTIIYKQNIDFKNHLEVMKPFFLCLSIAVFILLFRQRQQKFTLIWMRIISISLNNFGVFTVPIALLISQDCTEVIFMSFVTASCLIPFCILILSISLNDSGHIWPIFKNILKTPLIILPITALILRYYQMHLPDMLGSNIYRIGQSVPFLGLFIFGANLASIRLDKSILDRDSYDILLLKHLFMPFLLFILLHFFNTSSSSTSVINLMLIGLSPMGINVYLIASDYGIEAHKFRNLVAISSIISIFEIALIILLLR